eukprot:CAMPEP_0116885948 /NCGR_PEP_ID=MMETSP0463-20121206/19592_1 /TAXON_ID=181622 /ORGANISM="Strombidinopsis sp, Strain SopsisLIS2011" /LENGTH=69 /DNA_ID=CAMNT_0004545467 /DNA_START=138 /DNA_END=347 /DNA_ORIENTATION=+
MREKQRRAQLKAQGIDPDAPEPEKKTYDTSYLQQYEGAYDEEEVKEEQTETQEESKEDQNAGKNFKGKQ